MAFWMSGRLIFTFAPELSVLGVVFCRTDAVWLETLEFDSMSDLVILIPENVIASTSATIRKRCAIDFGFI